MSEAARMSAPPARPITSRAPLSARMLGLLLLLFNGILLRVFDTPFERALRNETFDV